MAAVMTDTGLPPDSRGEGGRVIVGVDDTPGGVAALRCAVALARARRARLVAVRAWGLGLPGTAAGGITVAAAAAWPSPIPEPCHANWPGNWPGVRSVPPQGTFRMISTW